MKISYGLVALWMLGFPQFSVAGEVTDSFNSGDTLTATQLNNIKSAVNDNDSRIDALEAADLISRVQALESALLAHIADLANPHAVTKAQVGLSDLENIRVNYTAISAPTVDDDLSTGYSVGSVWIDTVQDFAYVLLDSTPGAAVWKQISNQPKYYNVGDTGPAGGIVFYVTNNGLNGLEAARNDLPAAPWGCVATSTGASATGIEDGEVNSSTVLASGCQTPTDAIALADTFTLNDFSDWFLPSRGELEEMDLRIGPGSTDLGNIGGFSGTYFSSSEISVSEAWAISFGSSFNEIASKASARLIRPIRSF